MILKEVIGFVQKFLLLIREVCCLEFPLTGDLTVLLTSVPLGSFILVFSMSSIVHQTARHYVVRTPEIRLCAH